MNGYEVYNKNCSNVLPKVPDKSVDLVFYDPPYNVKKKYEEYKDNLPPEEYEAWMKEVACHAQRIAKRGVVVYVAGKLSRLFGNILPESHMIIVHKRAAGVCSGNYMLQYHSIFSTAKPVIKCKDLWNDVRLPGEGYFFKEPRYDNPGLTGLAMTEKVIHHFTEEGETVLDCFMGTGTTGVACVRKGRRFIGYELTKKYFNTAQERIEAAIKEMEIV